VAAIGSDGKAKPPAARAGKFSRYLRSPSTRMAAFGGLLTYLSYAYAHGSWANPTLICVSIFVGVFLPSYAKLSNKAELWANNQFGFVTAGRLGRFIPQLAFNLVMFWLMLWGGALNQLGIASVGGIAGAALVTTLASQGTQYLGGYLVARGVGDANRNTLISILVNVTLAALGTAGVPGAREAFLLLGVGLGGTLFLVGLLSDLRSVAAPKGGIGLFFGTYNPFHNSHIALLQAAIDQRGLDKVIMHPVLIPKLHVDAFRKEEIRVGHLKDGFQIYEKTDKADSNVDYFPTGNVFLPPQTRVAMIELALAEAGMADKVEVAVYSDIYYAKGFQGVIAEIKRRHPGVRLHMIHGTDFGGMLVRQISDECGWIYPWCILRRDQVSATAIRRGAKGMTPTVVTDVLTQISQNLPVVTAGGRRFRNDNGVLTEGN
ncbi:MAG: cytidylyltransferase family protein, partial [Reyranella sp.]|nr:cytidylyltransferase family protein [Reyranella sp.]